MGWVSVRYAGIGYQHINHVGLQPIKGMKISWSHVSLLCEKNYDPGSMMIQDVLSDGKTFFLMDGKTFSLTPGCSILVHTHTHQPITFSIFAPTDQIWGILNTLKGTCEK